MALPSHTKRFAQLTEADIVGIDLIISAGDSTEDRGHLPLWADVAKHSPARIAWISSIKKESISVSRGGESQDVNLYDMDAVASILSGADVLLDISGLPHHVWAPILHCLYKQKVSTRVLYAEPDSYKEHTSPISSSLFDLSVTIDGLQPLPGFARLSGPPDEEKCLFVALLGFEGNRPECLFLQIDPPPKIIPIVGVPGFQMEYPAFTVACNREFLKEYRAHSEIRYARASCPFEAVDVFKSIIRDYPGYYLYIAPVGTKPHALGAIMFALMHPGSTEIMFDHPVRRAGRTKGVGVIHIYNFGKFDVF